MSASNSAANTEFKSEGFFKDRYICYKYDFRNSLRRIIKRMLGRTIPATSIIKSRVSTRSAKDIVLQERLAVCQGHPSWFYTAYERGDIDPLTNYSLNFIEENISKDARVLVTGCGTGITAFHIADCGFREVVGIDLLREAIAVANRVKKEYQYSQTSFYSDDCFHPTLHGNFDVITAMHWVFSAWMGNYGNASQEAPRDPRHREELLNALLAAYTPHLNTDGVIIIELTDAVADYRLATDHPMGEGSLNIYPVRHSPAQVHQCAQANGLTVIDQKLCVSYGHQPRTAYYLKKS